MTTKNLKKVHRISRHTRIRSELSGTSERPRIAVFKSNQHTYVQVIDDVHNTTLVGMSSAKKKDDAFALGQAVAEALKTKGVSKAVFDRGGFKYHGRVKAIAEGLRTAGITI